MLSNNACPGTLLNESLHIACGEGTVIAITLLQRPGGRMLSSSEFLKGFLMTSGESLTIPKAE